MLFLRELTPAEDTALVPATPRPRRHFTIGEAIALFTLGGLIVLAIVGPLIAWYSPIVPSGVPFLPPGSSGHLLGTDNLGFDIGTRVVFGLRISLFAAVTVTVISAIAGMILGTIAAFVGGWLDSVLMRVTDLFLAFPATIVAMAIAASLGASLSSSMIGIAVVWWPMYARLTRGEVRRVINSPHVEAARMSGTRGVRLLVKHVLPSVVPTVLVTASLDVGAVVLTLASLSFIGLGTPAPAPELGLMASAGMQYILSAWWIAVVPGVAIALVALAFNYVGDGLRTVLRAKGF
ncbi:ABC transporter permease [Herbiconiux ginsengi]|uniref:Peptide/nickel transport system permease protein n=1 Tax=Herbiconiux ginsengi TaxID=381665 RepID=A0A1H3TI64_9MICO|nr:ABC transporter permease [Herbiconiux ginsengi]SDZ49558.1 peptide/nickel transport system permease protein [Herbiconiux ginsengi]